MSHMCYKKILLYCRDLNIFDNRCVSWQTRYATKRSNETRNEDKLHNTEIFKTFDVTSSAGREKSQIIPKCLVVIVTITEGLPAVDL